MLTVPWKCTLSPLGLLLPEICCVFLTVSPILWIQRDIKTHPFFKNKTQKSKEILRGWWEIIARLSLLGGQESERRFYVNYSFVIAPTITACL